MCPGEIRVRMGLEWSVKSCRLEEKYAYIGSMRQEPAAALVMIDSLEAWLQGTLNVIPAHTWYATPSGTLTFVNERSADYGGLPPEHPLRLGIDIGAAWDSHIALLH